jgi:hypothetical protein
LGFRHGIRNNAAEKKYLQILKLNPSFLPEKYFEEIRENPDNLANKAGFCRCAVAFSIHAAILAAVNSLGQFGAKAIPFRNGISIFYANILESNSLSGSFSLHIRIRAPIGIGA